MTRYSAPKLPQVVLRPPRRSEPALERSLGANLVMASRTPSQPLGVLTGCRSLRNCAHNDGGLTAAAPPTPILNGGALLCKTWGAPTAGSWSANLILTCGLRARTWVMLHVSGSGFDEVPIHRIGLGPPTSKPRAKKRTILHILAPSSHLRAKCLPAELQTGLPRAAPHDGPPSDLPPLTIPSPRTSSKEGVKRPQHEARGEAHYGAHLHREEAVLQQHGVIEADARDALRSGGPQ